MSIKMVHSVIEFENVIPYPTIIVNKKIYNILVENEPK